MAGTVMKETKSVSAGEAQLSPNKAVAGEAQGSEVECAKCECCGLTEECTPTYISRIRERHQGRWICGLCAEAVKDEVLRSEERRIGTEEALNRHMNFCKKFRSATPPPNPTEDLISAVKQLLLRCLESPRGVRSNPSSPRRKDEAVLSRSTFGRSQSCLSTMDA